MLTMIRNAQSSNLWAGCVVQGLQTIRRVPVDWRTNVPKCPICTNRCKWLIAIVAYIWIMSLYSNACLQWTSLHPDIWCPVIVGVCHRRYIKTNDSLYFYKVSTHGWVSPITRVTEGKHYYVGFYVGGFLFI